MGSVHEAKEQYKKEKKRKKKKIVSEGLECLVPPCMHFLLTRASQ
jgi:hypothetical protein